MRGLHLQSQEPAKLDFNYWICQFLVFCDFNQVVLPLSTSVYSSGK